MRLLRINPERVPQQSLGSTRMRRTPGQVNRIMNPNGVPQQWADETIINNGVCGRDVSPLFPQTHHVANVEPRWGSARSICNLGCAVNGAPRLCCGTALRWESQRSSRQTKKARHPEMPGFWFSQSGRTGMSIFWFLDYFLPFFGSAAFASSRAA